MYRLLEHQDDPLHFTLDSNEEKGNRFTVVIGPNGTGKSQLLRSIAEISRASIQEKTNELFAFHSEDTMASLLVLSNMVTDVFVNTSKHRDFYRYLGLRQASNNTSTGALRDITSTSILECFRIPSGMTRLWPVIETLGGNDIFVSFERINVRSKNSPDEFALVEKFLESLEQDYERSHYVAAKALLAELQKFNNSTPRYGEFFSLDAPQLNLFWSISARFQLDAGDLTRILRRLGYATLKVHLNITNRSVDLDGLSTGQLLLLSTFARVAANVGPDSLVIIDEPEVGLHPNWQSEWIPLMRETIPSEYGCHLFIATHSPYLVSDADDVLVPGEEWGTFAQFGEPHQGRSVENILYRVFNARVSGNLMVENDLRTLIQFISRGPLAFTRDHLEQPTKSNYQLQRARDALARLRHMQGQDTENLNLIIAQASKVLDR